MVCAVSLKVFGIGPLGFCFGQGTKFRGVRALVSRIPSKVVGLNLIVVQFQVTVWK